MFGGNQSAIEYQLRMHDAFLIRKMYHGIGPKTAGGALKMAQLPVAIHEGKPCLFPSVIQCEQANSNGFVFVVVIIGKEVGGQKSVSVNRSVQRKSDNREFRIGVRASQVIGVPEFLYELAQAKRTDRIQLVTLVILCFGQHRF